MEYLLFAVMSATAMIGAAYLWRNRRGSPSKSVNTFERALKALDPERKGKRHQT